MANVVSKVDVFLSIDNTIIVSGETFWKEDVDGITPGVKVTYDDGSIELYVCIGFGPTNFVTGVVNTIVNEYVFRNGTWSKFNSGKFRIEGYSFMRIENKDTYVNKTTGAFEPNPYEDDLTKEILDENNESYTPKKYQQKVKDTVETEYIFWHKNLGKPHIFSAMQNTIKSRF